MAVVADQTVLGGEPDESLGILQAVVDRALRQPLGGREVLEDERRRFERPAGRATSEPATTTAPPPSMRHRRRATHIVHWFGTHGQDGGGLRRRGERPVEEFVPHQGTDLLQV